MEGKGFFVEYQYTRIKGNARTFVCAKGLLRRVCVKENFHFMDKNFINDSYYASKP